MDDSIPQNLKQSPSETLNGAKDAILAINLSHKQRSYLKDPSPPNGKGWDDIDAVTGLSKAYMTAMYIIDSCRFAELRHFNALLLANQYHSIGELIELYSESEDHRHWTDTKLSSRIGKGHNRGSYDQAWVPSYKSSHSSATPRHHAQRQSPKKYQHDRTLLPDTDVSSSVYSMNRAPSYVSNDSGYATRSTSILTPSSVSNNSGYATRTASILAPSFVSSNSGYAASYTRKAHSIQSYIRSSQQSQQSLNSTWDNQRTLDNENVHIAPTAASEDKENQRLRTPSPSSPPDWPCLHLDCDHISFHFRDFERHMTEHFAVKELQVSEESPDQEIAGLKVSIQGTDPEMPEALDAGQVGHKDRTAATSNDEEIDFFEINNAEMVRMELKEYLFGDVGDRVQCEHRHPTEMVLGEDGNSTISMSRQSTKDKLASMKSQILKTFLASEAGQYRASLRIQWDILGFIEDQFSDSDFPNTALGPVVTVSGSAQHAQATTCSEYIRQNWPVQGPRILDSLQDALDSPTKTSRLNIAACIDDKSASTSDTSSGHAQLAFNVTKENLFLDIQSGTPEFIVEVVQQLAWMGAALRTSRDGRIQYCESKLDEVLQAQGVAPALFSVTFEMSSPGEEDQSCWFPLFTNPVIAREFPVPKRENGEQGLEVPLELMAALGGARYVTEFDGGLVLKGYSAMFVPVQRHKHSIQWHLIRHSDEERMLYRQLRNEGLIHAMLDEVDQKSLQTTRAFLGWWKSSETHLGTGDAAYDRVDWSPASEAKRPTRFSGANIGFQTMLTGQLNFIMGAKDGRLHFSQKGPFQRIVQCAEKTPVVLYDIEDQRAWLVPALDVMLHVVQTRHHLSPYRIDGGDIELTPVNPENGRGAATEAVAANQLRQLYERDIAAEKGYYFKDAMLDIWSQMERLMEKDDSIEAIPGLALHGTMRSKVHGWEYMSLVHEKNYRRKEATIAKSSGGWVDLINDVDALVLFATGFDEIIRPVTDLSKLCAPWRSLPKGKDYLAAGIPILELLYSEAGSRLSHKHLTTSHLQWQRGSTLFEQCSYAALDRCKCDRTQQIYHDSLFKTFGRVRPPGHLEENGCAIFGQARHPFRPLKNVAIRQNTVHVVPNNPIRAAAVTKKVTFRDDMMISPSPPTSVSSESGEFNDFGSGNPKRLPSSLSDHLVQEEAIPPRRRRNMSYLQKQNLDTFADPNNINDQISLLDDCAICPVDYQLMFKHNLQSREEYLASAQTALPSKAESVPVHARKTVHRKGNGCPCATCPMEDFEPPGSIEFVDTTNDARRNTTKLVERRQRQAV